MVCARGFLCARLSSVFRGGKVIEVNEPIYFHFLSRIAAHMEHWCDIHEREVNEEKVF